MVPFPFGRLSSAPAAEDEFRLTCGARGRLLIAASFRT
jgi:hypothetical protein